jgi:hypothetical protein
MTPILADHRHGRGPGARVETGVKIVTELSASYVRLPLAGSEAFSIGAHGR